MPEAAPAARVTITTLLTLLSAASAVAAQAPCPDSEVLEREGYRVTEVRVNGPLHTESALLENLRARGARIPQRGDFFSVAAFHEVRQQMREVLRAWPTLFDSPAAVSVVRAEVSSCRAETREVDLTYSFVTTRVPSSFTAWEVHGATARDPEQRGGLGPLRRIRFGPTVAYDRALGLRLGGRVTTLPEGGWLRLLAEGSRSPQAHNASLRAEGEHISETGFFSQVDWRLAIDHSSIPSKQSQIQRSRAAGELTAFTRPSPLGRIRLGLALEGGQQAADELQSTPVAFVRKSGYGQLGGFLQLVGSGARQATSAFYGLGAGTTGSGLDYLKHTLDLAAAFYLPTPRDAHRRLTIESRVAAGSLDAIGRTPVTERFFGGSSTFDDDTWHRLAGPLVRSLPPFALASAGEGGGTGVDRFAAVNLTVAFDVWYRPLVPEEVSRDAEVRAEVEGQLNSGEATLAALYAIRDPAHIAVLADQARVLSTVERLEAAVNEVEPPTNEDAQARLEQCQIMVAELTAGVAAWTRTTPVAPYVAPPTSDDDPTMPGVEAACTGVNAILQDTAIARALNVLATERRFIQDQITRIDIGLAEALAREDMRFPRRAVRTIFDELNLVSLSPVFLFDVAHVRESEPLPLERTRYALGGGVRVTLASAFTITFTYAADPVAREGERSGTATLSMRVLNLF